MTIKRQQTQRGIKKIVFQFMTLQINAKNKTSIKKFKMAEVNIQVLSRQRN
jgi:hypothetical protein